MPYDPVTGQIVPLYDPYSEVGYNLASQDPLLQLEAIQRRNAARRRQQQAFVYTEEELGGTQSTDRYDQMGRLISDFDMQPGKDDLSFYPAKPAQPAQPAQPGYRGQDSSPGMPGPAMMNIGGMRMTPQQYAQLHADAEARSVDAALGAPGGSPSVPFPIQDATIQTLGTTPDPKQGPPKTAAQIDSANRWTDIGVQAGIAAIIGGLQVGSAFIPTEAQKLAKETVDEWGGDAPEKYGEQVRRESMDRGRAALNRRTDLGRQVQEDIAASAGNVDAGAQQDIRNAMMSAFTVGEAELEANATALGLEAAKEKTAMYNSAVAYVSQIRTARMQAVEGLLKGLAPVAAQFGVNRGIEVMSTDIAKLDPQYQDMFYNLSSGAKNQTELARAYAHVQLKAEKAAQAAAKAAADAATTQAATP